MIILTYLLTAPPLVYRVATTQPPYRRLRPPPPPPLPLPPAIVRRPVLQVPYRANLGEGGGGGWGVVGGGWGEAYILRSSSKLWYDKQRGRPPLNHCCLNVTVYSHCCPLLAPIVQELCESRGGRPGLSVLTSLLVSVDVKLYWTMLRHWSQLVPNMSTDIWGH